ncbi:tensin-3 [Caerostris darwini]|uniref:Tensin-3 n=1 Tax=Caerostris darwini TaxID=1538125 RepID=A0AAV4P8L4_9ARAC|nr:tensin-3 [Caerostris darwini]
MSGNRDISATAASRSGHSGMASGLTDCRGARPDNLLPGIRKFSEQERANLWSPCSDCSSSDENNSPTALNSFNWDKPALEDKSVDFGWTASQDNINGKIGQSKTTGRKKINPCSEKKAGSYVNLQQVDSKYLRDCTTLEPKQSPTKAHELTQGCGSSSESLKPERIYPLVDLEEAVEPKAPPASLLEEDESYESRTDEEIEREKEELRNVAWFQAGIPREIALEVLAEKPEGSFIVRKSTTKHGCYALSLRVPQEKNPTGIAHYLILQTNKGYKIKGFTKEFTSLKALITHHSVMPELLPCPLNLSREHTRDAEHEFEETEQKSCDIFSDIHWLMTDLEV